MMKVSFAGWRRLAGCAAREEPGLALGVMDREPAGSLRVAGRADGTFVGIQALRAVAALVVVYGHLVNLLARQHAVVSAGLERLPGAIGVDLFFVISGFVITVSADGLVGKARPAGVFLWRRVLRVVPLYWLLTAGKVLLLGVMPKLSARGAPPWWNVVTSFLFVPSMNAAGEIRPVIPVGWTLNFEAFFYVLFAVALLRRGKFVRVLLPLTCAVGLLGFLRTPAWPVGTVLADPILFEFMAGVGIALLVKRGWMPGRAAGWMLLVAGGVGLAAIAPGVVTTANRPLLWGLPAAMVVLGCATLEPGLKRVLPRWLLLLGSASYAIYLVQTFVLPGLGLVLARGGRLGQVAEVGLGLLVTTLAGVGVHLLVERPVTAMLKRRFGAERIAPIARVG